MASASPGVRKRIGLHLDTRRIAEQLRNRSTLGTQLAPDTSPEPTVDRPLVDSALARLSALIPDYDGAGAARYWAGLVDLTPDGLPIIDGGTGPEGLTIVPACAVTAWRWALCSAR